MNFEFIGRWINYLAFIPYAHLHAMIFGCALKCPLNCNFMAIATLLRIVLFGWIFRKIFQAPKIFVPHEQIYVFNMNTIFMQLSQPVDEVKLKLLKVNSVHKSPINFTILLYFIFYSIVTTRNTLLKPSVTHFHSSAEHCPLLTLQFTSTFYLTFSIN